MHASGGSSIDVHHAQAFTVPGHPLREMAVGDGEHASQRPQLQQQHVQSSAERFPNLLRLKNRRAIHPEIAHLCPATAFHDFDYCYCYFRQRRRRPHPPVLSPSLYHHDAPFVHRSLAFPDLTVIVEQQPRDMRLRDSMALVAASL